MNQTQLDNLIGNEIADAYSTERPFLDLLPSILKMSDIALNQLAKPVGEKIGEFREVLKALYRFASSDRRDYLASLARKPRSSLQDRERVDLMGANGELIWRSMREILGHRGIWQHERMIRFLHRMIEGTAHEGYALRSVLFSGTMRSHNTEPNLFVLSEALTYKLLATDLRGVINSDIRLPLQGFAFCLPPGIFVDIEGADLRDILVAQSELPGPEWAFENVKPGRFISTTTQGFRDGVDGVCHHYMTIDVSDDMREINDDLLTEMDKRHGLHGSEVLVLGRRVSHSEFRQILLSFIANFCVYMHTESSTVVSRNAQEIERLHEGKKLKNLRKNVQQRIHRLMEDRTFDVGTDVVISAELREAVRGGEGTALSYRVLVRGHWRNQAHGPNHSLRRIKWIEPHVRGAALPTPVMAHNYKV